MPHEAHKKRRPCGALEVLKKTVRLLGLEPRTYGLKGTRRLNCETRFRSVIEGILTPGLRLAIVSGQMELVASISGIESGYWELSR